MKKILLIALTLFSASAINAQTLLARYPMDSNANDVSGNGNNGTINGSVTPVADRFGTPGSALQFSGGNISTSFYGVGGNGNRTIVFWCKIDPGSNGGVPFSYGGGPTGGDFANNFIPGSGWYFDASNTAGTFACRVNDGAWHQYMVTFDNSIALNTTGLRFYRDGTELNNLVGPYNWGGEFLSTWSNTPLGMGSGNIAMDEFKMYSGAFTRTQVDSIYKAEATYNSCLVGKYDFNNNGFDYSPSRTNASSVLASQDYDRAGNYGAAYAFSGAPGTTAGPCSTVQIPDSLLPMGSTPRTVMAWMKTSDAINDQVVIDYGTLGSGNRCALMVSSGIALMRIDGVDMPVGNVADGLWHHVAFSCNGSTGNIFIDGVGINSGPFAFNTLSSLYMNVGATTPNGSSQTECFNGNIDDIRIFNCSLTGTQIDSIYDHEKVCNLSVTATMNQNITCAGGSDGSATATVVSGGVAPYLYSWAPGSQTAQTPTDLTVGAHTVTVTDNVGCVATATVNITEPAPVTPFISSQTDVDCYGNSTGAATVAGAGGAGGPYTYSWLALGTTDTETGLTAGSYSCTVTDMMGCSVVQTVNITEPGPMTYSVLTGPSHNTCFGGASGSMNIMGMGGDWSFSYLWSPGGQTVSNPSDLIAGDHTVTITDGHGCTFISPIITIFEPAQLQANFTITHVSCNGANDGMINAAATGGTGTIYYNWISPAAGATSLVTGLGPNSYNLELTDDNSCFVSLFPVVNEPAVITANVTATDVTCTGFMNGILVSNPSGGTAPFSFLWNGGSTNDSIVGLSPGTYSVNITDANGCTKLDSGAVTEPTNIVSSASGSDPLCFGGSDGTAVNNPTGGTPPYTYLWSPSGQTTQTATGLSSGNHSVTITDANGCTAGDISALSDPPVLTAIASTLTNAGCFGQTNGSADVIASGGTGAYSYSWTTGGTSSTETNMGAGTHTITVTDANACTVSDVATITDIASTDLQGEITAATLNISNGFVLAFKVQAASNGIDTVATTPIIAGTPNRYNFGALQADDYLIKVLPNANAYPTSVPTYYGDVFQWDSSIVVTHGCSQNDTADIQVLEILSAPAGDGFISGFILEADGYQGLRIMSGANPNIPFAPGGPLKGIDVKLGKNPGGGIQARTMTDTTGYYNFDSIPDGNYTIYVDIPNLPMDSTRTLTIAGLDSSFQNNYFADSVFVFITDTVIVPPISIHSSEKVYENKFSVYPNPAKNNLFVRFDLDKTGDVNIELTNALGQAIRSEYISNILSGTYTHPINISALNLKAGVYFISVFNEGRRYTQRLVVIE